MANAAETADFRMLRENVATLKKRLVDFARHGRSAAAAGANQANDGLAARSEQSTDAAGGSVRGAPLASVAAAFLLVAWPVG